MPIVERKQEIKVSNELIKKLKKKGFKVNMYYAKKTKSIYLKIDFGVCCVIRISDHIGNQKHRFKFNIIKQYNGPKQINDNGYLKLFYNYEDIGKLVKDIEIEKQIKIIKHGVHKYNQVMRENSKRKLYTTLKNVV